MPGMVFTAPKARNQHVPFGSLIHNDVLIYVREGNSYTKYYIIVAIIAAIIIFHVILAINLQLRLNKGLQPRAYEKFLFKGVIRKHERKVASAAHGNSPPDFYNMANVTPGPVNDSTVYTAYPGHTYGGDRFDSVQELNKRADEENALPVNDVPLGPPPAAVLKQ
ncbi:hypothetical protein N5P37_004970 [Trichoderma harzianum]|uniref:Uncharacterized protein n=1 Tax=Trichoderma harzianum CBS 226.95 TaxID=983964 RepID=A0A2T4ADE3_TRIHA|nr:hypothetical protein M431DRAFT_85832 [Trichoderma harzianum CBS 226.95]KAK0762167.1 hypothetical protein N5P37_004970 [Trichoderma harzianum]PKK53684.1 hypothetical protein CI102_1483 [Trichoderma harzianum]PTB55107.1 hypothetical protein M431DRAFT_85832 [Trichoderma harzianum CBS 226.95]